MNHSIDNQNTNPYTECYANYFTDLSTALGDSKTQPDCLSEIKLRRPAQPILNAFYLIDTLKATKGLASVSTTKLLFQTLLGTKFFNAPSENVYQNNTNFSKYKQSLERISEEYDFFFSILSKYQDVKKSYANKPNKLPLSSTAYILESDTSNQILKKLCKLYSGYYGITQSEIKERINHNMRRIFCASALHPHQLAMLTYHLFIMFIDHRNIIEEDSLSWYSKVVTPLSKVV